METTGELELGGSRPCDADRLLDYAALNVERIRRDFPILNQTVNGKPLSYLDNAASTQKPAQVVAAIKAYYETDHANVHRGVHTLSQRATQRFDEARVKVQRFLGASQPHEIVFTKGCTEAINLVASSWGRANLRQGDVVMLSELEHHANIVPWQIVCEATGATIRVIPIDDDGNILLDELANSIDERVKFVSVVHISNAIGTINPIKEIARIAHGVGAKILADGAQATAHLPIDVQELDVDFYTLSGHKLYGPTGVGALYGRESLLEAMPPYQAGGDMIKSVTFEKTQYAGLPNKFEPGTPHISGFIALGVAIDYLADIGLDDIGEHECNLAAEAEDRLSEILGVRLIGRARSKSAIVSFVMDCAHPHDIGTILDSEGVAIRAGHHCCMPLMERLGIPATARASFGLYNTAEEVNRLVNAVAKVKEIFG